jgi:predicted nuclease of predicted toxin-antitoxin system
MKFWVDAQLPPALAGWLAENFGVEAVSVKELGLRDAKDQEIFDAARKVSAVLISKDSDFVDLVTRLGSPSQLLLVTCGNATNRRLRDCFLS